MKQQITNIIIEMIGEDKKDYKLDDGNIITAVTMPYIREKAPEIAERIIGAINKDLLERFGENPRILTFKRK